MSAASEAGGLCAVRGHRCAVPAAAGGRLELSVPVQQQSGGSHVPGARGATHRLVQPLRSTPVLRPDRRQLRSHAHEHDPHPTHTLQGTVLRDTHA